jgi:WD40 repeat protein
MLSVIRTAPYKILVGRGDIAELWNHEGRLDAVLRGHEDAITDVQFSPDTNLAITCSFDSTAKLWGVGSQECLFTLKHERMVVTGAFSTTGTTVVTTMFSHELKQWCVRSGDCISTLRLSHKGAFDFAFIAQGVHVLHTVEDCITLWNMGTGTPEGPTTSVSLCGTSRTHACPNAVTGSAPSSVMSEPDRFGIPRTFGMPRHAHTIAG